MGAATQPCSLVAGRYYFVVDGPDNMVGTGQYEFMLHRIVTTAQTLALNTGVGGSIDSLGQRYDYRFSLKTPTSVLFHSLNTR